MSLTTVPLANVPNAVDPSVYGTIVNAYASANPGDADVTGLAALVTGGAFVSKYHYTYNQVLEKALDARLSGVVTGMVFRGVFTGISDDIQNPTLLDNGSSSALTGDFFHINTISTGLTGYVYVTGGTAFEVHAGDNLVYDGAGLATFDGPDISLTGSADVSVAAAPTTNGYSYTVSVNNTVEYVTGTNVALENLSNAYNGVVKRLQQIEAYLALVEANAEIYDGNGNVVSLTGSLPAWPAGYTGLTAPSVADIRGATGTFQSTYVYGS